MNGSCKKCLALFFSASARRAVASLYLAMASSMSVVISSDCRWGEGAGRGGGGAGSGWWEGWGGRGEVPPTQNKRNAAQAFQAWTALKHGKWKACQDG